MATGDPLEPGGEFWSGGASPDPAVAIRGMLYGHYGIGCLLETCQATPLMIWGPYAASTYVFLAPK